MSVVVELFGILAREAGTKEVTIEIGESISVEKLLDEVTKAIHDTESTEQLKLFDQ